MIYFSLPELRALPDMADVVKYSDSRLTAAGDWIETLIEREVGTSFVARSVTDTLDGNCQEYDGGLKLSKRYAQNVTAVTSNGVAFGGPALAEVSVRNGYAYRRTAGDYTGFIAWDYGTRNIVVTYNAGYSTSPPSDIKEAALQGARYRVLSTDDKSGISDRALSISNEQGTIQLATPGTRFPTGLPEVDAVIVGWRNKLDLYGFG